VGAARKDGVEIRAETGRAITVFCSPWNASKSVTAAATHTHNLQVAGSPETTHACFCFSLIIYQPDRARRLQAG
jgi:hypothetical protein